jgi:hypothetical protein
MFIYASRREAQTFDPTVVRPLHVRPVRTQPSLREEHARMLTIAAARRLRAVERAAHQRCEDAGYWKEVAPFAVARAVVLRAQPGFARLP